MLNWRKKPLGTRPAVLKSIMYEMYNQAFVIYIAFGSESLCHIIRDKYCMGLYDKVFYNKNSGGIHGLSKNWILKW